MSKEIKVRIRGISDYLQHKRPIEDKEISQRSGEVDYSKDAEKSLYRDDEIGCYIPSKQIRACLVKGSVNFKVKGKGHKTFKDLVNATVEIDPDKIPLGRRKADYIHQEFVRIQRNQILRSRPAFKKGWEAQFSLLVLDDQMPVTQLENILGYSGKFVGIGDWRPHFGRFEVVEFEN